LIHRDVPLLVKIQDFSPLTTPLPHLTPRSLGSTSASPRISDRFTPMPRSNSRSLARFHPAGPSFPFLHTGSHSPPLKIMAACQPRLWSNDEETRELPGECEQQYRVQAGEEGHARPGWTTSRRGQDSPWKSQSERQRTKINGESTSMVWPTVGSKSAKEQNRTVNRDSALMTRPRRLTAALRLSGAKNTFAPRG